METECKSFFPQLEEEIKDLFEKGVVIGRKKEREEVLEILDQVRYESHDPSKECMCDICKTIERIKNLWLK